MLLKYKNFVLNIFINHKVYSGALTNHMDFIEIIKKTDEMLKCYFVVELRVYYL